VRAAPRQYLGQFFVELRSDELADEMKRLANDNADRVIWYRAEDPPYVTRQVSAVLDDSLS
jgi:hypothetical protein